LLLIIDHGSGYMSLYGHSQRLLKEPGAWVDAGDAVATVGNSGGYTEPSLYFAVRYNGKPTDPGRWLGRR
jgi:septal ring factor EnvC (AmiA/AmiB activator)